MFVRVSKSRRSTLKSTYLVLSYHPGIEETRDPLVLHLFIQSTAIDHPAIARSTKILIESPASVAFRAGSLLSEVSHRWWAVLGGSLEHRSNCVDSCGFDARSAMFYG